VFLNELEKDLRSGIGYKGALPYWSWGVNNDNWMTPSAGILTANFFGQSGYGTPNGCVVDGIAASWKPLDNQCITRFYNPNPASADRAYSLYNEALLLAIVQGDPWNNYQPHTSYDSFRHTLERSVHNYFHIAIGSYSGQNVAGTMTNVPVSSSDPTFWLHHGNMDKYYSLFLKMHPQYKGVVDGTAIYPPAHSGTSAAKAGPSNLQVPVTASTLLPGFNVPVSVGANEQQGDMCYQYQVYSGSITKVTVNGNTFQRRTDVEEGGKHLQTVVTLPIEIQDGLTQLNAKLASIPTRCNNVGSSQARVQPRLDFMKMPESFIVKMGMNETKVREGERAMGDLQNRIYKETDSALQTYFGRQTLSQATPEEIASATKIALVIMKLKQNM
jgi:hypothetical protein